jgi:hypothetical protein
MFIHTHTHTHTHTHREREREREERETELEQTFALEGSFQQRKTSNQDQGRRSQVQEHRYLC